MAGDPSARLHPSRQLLRSSTFSYACVARSDRFTLAHHFSRGFGQPANETVDKKDAKALNIETFTWKPGPPGEKCALGVRRA